MTMEQNIWKGEYVFLSALVVMTLSLLGTLLSRALGPDPHVMRITMVAACLAFATCTVHLARRSMPRPHLGTDERIAAWVCTGTMLFGAVAMTLMAIRVTTADDAWILAHVMAPRHSTGR